MNTTALKKFAQAARRQLLEQVATRMEQVLRTDSVEVREKARVVEELKRQIQAASKAAVIDRVAYTWFNRFCALRFMDVNHYTRIGIVSPVEGFTQPEMLQEAKQGVIDESYKVDRSRVMGLLNGQFPSRDHQQEAYRLLLVGACNAYHVQMPFLFPEIEDYTELLMPDDLLSENSVLHAVRETLTPEACEDVEVIGWLYQFYISERKDEVFEALKKNQKIEAEDIPAATQLFTPHWIVRYLVENSLGRLWMLNHPESRLLEKMAYYIRNQEEGRGNQDENRPLEPEYLKISSPEEIKLCDPACGSGHMLTYAFDLLYAIYEEQGYDPVQIPRLILENNLYGIEIDERAGALAAFALTMKAREKDRRFFQRKVTPQICVLENEAFNEVELMQYMNVMGRDLFTEPLKETLRRFEQAENFGSLIRPILKDAGYVREVLAGKNLGGQLFLHSTHERVLQVLKFAEFLAPRYHVVVANPPYMGNGGMNEVLKDFTKANYTGSSDLYGCFIEMCLDLIVPRGMIGMITIPNWMFIASFENLREMLINNAAITSLIHNGRGVWGSDFGSCSFTLSKQSNQEIIGIYKRLFIRQGEVNPNEVLNDRFFDPENFPIYEIATSEFKKIPGTPIAYWASDKIRSAFAAFHSLGDIALPRKGLVTLNDAYFIHQWYEIEKDNSGFSFRNKDEAQKSRRRWIPINKGGGYRKWFGVNEAVINWFDDGKEIKEWIVSKYNGASYTKEIRSENFYFQENITWGSVTSGPASFRYTPNGFLFSSGGPSMFPQIDIRFLLAFLNSKVAYAFLRFLSPTLNYVSGDIARLPVWLGDSRSEARTINLSTKIIEISEWDWNSFETSWGFKNSPLLDSDFFQNRLNEAYISLFSFRNNSVVAIKKLEEENNQLFIEAYDLKDELTPDVPLSGITLTCNPYYRYDAKKTEAELEALLKADTMKEFISYAVGCMFGRYSLDKPGLILANQGEGIDDFRLRIADCGVAWEEVRFKPDEDNAIPILEGEWFNDDIAGRFKKFLRVTFGDEHFDENLAFIEDAIGRDIRSYFVKDFYNEHVKMYKKRPIYWLFSSPKGSFNVLIYMHRYRPDTISVILNQYLRAYREKLTAHRAYLEQVSINPSATQSDKTKALKEMDQIGKVLAELKAYEDEVLYPLATKRLEIDLDDGVKVNYAKFGGALRKISGL